MVTCGKKFTSGGLEFYCTLAHGHFGTSCFSTMNGKKSKKKKVNKGGRPRKDTVALTARVSPNTRKLFQEEAESRGLTLGELFEEICASRVTLIDRRPSNV